MPLPSASVLLSWYAGHRRLLPWRAPPGEAADPYHVWLSEIMLQQTVVATVIPYYRKFVARWPTIFDLAAAPVEEVCGLWAGLGYYARARNLLACAVVVAAQGGFPKDPAGLRALPGIGPYTAAAIAAIAFRVPVLPVDGNVERVAARIFAVTEPLPGARARIAGQAAALLRDAARAAPGDFAQALFDLGAGICTPRHPACAICPWRGDCLAAARGIAASLPARAPRPARPGRSGTAYVLLDGRGDVALLRRPPRGLLGGMLALPETPPAAADWREAGKVRHVFTHFSLDLAVRAARVAALPPGWLAAPAAGAALPSVMRKALDAGVRALDVPGMLDPHDGLLALDSHVDIPWPIGPSPFENGPRCVDLPKLRAGRVAAVCFAAYIPQGPRDAAGHEAAAARVFAMLDAIAAMAPADGGGGVLADSAEAVEAAFATGRVAIIPAVENGYAIGRDLALLDALRARGVRYMTLTHNGHNALADAAIPRGDLGDAVAEHGGLSALGRAAILRMNELGMLVDISHAAKTTMLQAAALSKVPVLATHSCMRALCDHPRNLDDEQLDVLGATGGLAQVTIVSNFLKARAHAADVTVADIANHIDYAVRRIGVDHVGIGTDFDGGGGVRGFSNAAQAPALTAELARRGYDRAALVKIWGGNFLRLLRLAEVARRVEAAV